MALLGKFFGNTVGQGAAFAIGATTARTLDPILQEVANQAWSVHPDKPIEAGTLALGVAQGQIPHDWAVDEAARTGINGERFQHLIDAANTGPGSAYAFDLWRRGVIDESGFRRAVKRLGLESEWINDLVALHDVLLTPAELANARQQAFVTPERQLAEAALQGITNERAEIQYELAGLPPGAATAQEYLNRGLIDEATFAQMIREGHTKTKYTDVLKKGARYVLSPIQYVEGRLRGWLTDAEMYAGTALHGVTQEDTDLLFKIHGRPISFRQTFIGRRRGGILDGPTAGIDDAFLASLRRSNIQPSFYNLAWAQRYTYPSAFVLRNLTQSGDITQARAEEVLLFEGWEPGFAKQVSEAWAGGGGTSADPHVTKAQNSLWTTMHRSYVAEESDATALQPGFQLLGVPADAQSDILAAFDAERALIRKQLTPTQVKKAWQKAVVNPATGLPWTRDEALTELLDRGYSANDANTFLDT